MSDVRETSTPEERQSTRRARKGAGSGKRRGQTGKSVRQNRRPGVSGEGPTENGADPRRNRRSAGANAPNSSPRFGKEEAGRLLDDRLQLQSHAFLLSSALDFVLVLAVSAALAFTVSYGFRSAADLRGNVALICAMQAPLIAAMFWGTWKRRAVPLSIGASVAVAVVIVGAAIAASSEPLFSSGGYNDADGNYATFAMVAVACSALCFLLSRTRLGLVIMLAGGIVACGSVQFLWREWIVDEPGLLSTAVFLGATAMLFVYQTYKHSVYTAKRAKQVSFLGAFGFSAIVGVACVLVGLGVFYGAIDGLGLKTPEFKPFEETVARPVDELEGIYDETDIEGDEKTDEVSDKDSDTRDNAEGGSGTSAKDRVENVMNAPIVGNLMQQLTGFDFEEENQDYENISYLILQITVAFAALLILLVLVVAALIQRSRRSRRLKSMEKSGMPYAQRIWVLYGFLMGRFRRLKMGKPDQLTPYEFAIGFEEALAPFSRDTGGVSFLDVTRAYMDAVWGSAGEHENASSYEKVEVFYKAFFKNARERVGWPKWLLWKFWRI